MGSELMGKGGAETDGWYMPMFCESVDVDPQVTVFCIGSFPVGPSMLLTAGYILAILLLIGYLIFEHSWIHHGRRTENVYIMSLLLLVQGFCFVEFHWRGIRVGTSKDVFVTDIFRHVISMLLFTHMVHVYASYSKLARFGGSGQDKHRAAAAAKPGGKSAGKRRPDKSRGLTGSHQDQAAYEAVRITEEIESLVEDVLKNFRRSDSSVSFGAHLAELLWVICLVSNFAWAFLNMTVVLQRVLFALEILLFGYTWWLGAKRLCLKYLPPAKALHRVIAQLVEYSEPMMLENVLVNLDVPDLLEAIAFRTLVLLTDTASREGLLTMLSKCVLLDALQKRGLKQRSFAEEAMKILLTCHGRELTLVKNSIDEGGDYHNLYKFIYIDIKDWQIRRTILDHLEEQALAQRSHLGQAFGLKILSDIDDTLYSSGGHFPAGCDKRYPRNVVYPGCLTLFRILDRMWRENVATEPCCNLVFLSARPHIYKHYSEDVSYRKFKHLHDEGRLHCMPTMLPGELNSGVTAIFKYVYKGARAWKKVGKKKLEMYRKFRDLYMEYDFVFFGDNGQGDLWAGGMMDIEHQNANMRPEEGPLLLGVFIHCVMDENTALSCGGHPKQSSSIPAQPLTSLNFCEDPLTERSSVSMHRTYVGAALTLHVKHPQLVSTQDLVAVARDAVEEFDSMRLVYAEWGSNWEEAESELRADLQVVRSVLDIASQELVPQLERTERILRRSASSRKFIPAKALVRRSVHALSPGEHRSNEGTASFGSGRMSNTFLPQGLANVPAMAQRFEKRSSSPGAEWTYASVEFDRVGGDSSAAGMVRGISTLSTDQGVREVTPSSVELVRTDHGHGSPARRLEESS